jgi:hypothetical protein
MEAAANVPAAPVVSVYQNENTRVVEAVHVDDQHCTFQVFTTDNLVSNVPRNIVTDFCGGRGSSVHKKAAFKALANLDTGRTCLAAVPFAGAHVPAGCQHVDVCAYVLPAARAPVASFFPVNWRLYSGLTLVELEPVLDADTGLRLTQDYFTTNSFAAAVSAATADMRGANHFSDVPGFVLPETAKLLRQFTSMEEDPILHTFRPDYCKSAACDALLLQPEDYAFFGWSDWSNTSPETRQLAGHKEAEKHFYLCLKYHLPVESVDQLRLLIHLNPQNDSWRKLLERKVFSRAQEYAAGIRRRFMERILSRFHLAPKQSNPYFVDTPFDVFDTATIRVKEKSGLENEGVAFHSGCTPTHASQLGVLCEVCSSERDAGLLWIHGPAGGRIGGQSWTQTNSSNSLPVLTGPTGRVTKKTMDAVVQMGWSRQNGFAKIVPMVFI